MNGISVEKVYRSIYDTYKTYRSNGDVWYRQDYISILLNHLKIKFEGHAVQLKFIEKVYHNREGGGCWISSEDMKILLGFYCTNLISKKETYTNINKKAIEAIRRVINETKS